MRKSTMIDEIVVIYAITDDLLKAIVHQGIIT